MSSRNNPSYGSNRTPIGSYNPSDGEYIMAPDDTSEYSDSVASKVMASPAYQQAFRLFVDEPDKTWLQRLQAIPHSVQDAKETWFDQIGIVTNHHDKQSANYQYCIEQINALVAEYQAWKNSLPVSQVNQQSVVGYNSAITGQNVGASSIPNVGVSSNPSTLESTDMVDVFGSAISTASSLLSSISGGALSWVSLFNQVSQFDRSMSETTRMNDHTINKDQVATNLALAEKGIDTIADTSHAEVISSSNYFTANQTEQLVKDKEAVLKDYTTPNFGAGKEGSELKKIYDTIANLKFDLMLKRLKVESLKQDYEGKLHQFNSGYLTDDPKSFGASKSDYEKSQYEYDTYVKKRTLELLRDFSEKSKKGSIVHSYMLDNILTGIDIKSLALLGAGKAVEPVADIIFDKIGADINL